MLTKPLKMIDLSDCDRFLEPDFGMKTACAWLNDKFGIELQAPDEMKDFDSNSSGRSCPSVEPRKLTMNASRSTPCGPAMSRFASRDRSGTQQGFQKRRAVKWAKTRFGVELSLDDLKNKQREEIRKCLLEHSRKNNARANEGGRRGSATRRRTLF